MNRNGKKYRNISMNDIYLSIIIPVYNEENIIENTVIEVERALQ